MSPTSAAPTASTPANATQHSRLPVGYCVGTAAPCPVNRVHVYDRALAGLRCHLLPLLRDNLQDVAARTGLPAETLRKRRRDLERGTRSLPGVDALASIASAYGWSLDALLDGESDSPARHDVGPAAPSAVAPALRAHIRHVVSSTVRRAKPWALDAVLGRDPDELLERFEREMIERIRDLLADRERRQRQQWEEEWARANVMLAGTSAVEQVAIDSALAPYAEVLVTRLQHALREGKWEGTDGRFAFTVVARASDPWEVARGLTPAMHRLTMLVGSRVSDAVRLSFEITAAEVDVARHALARSVGRGAGLRACTFDEVLEAYGRFRRARRFRPHAPRSLAVIDGAAAQGDRGPLYDAWALSDLFVAFCEQVGLVWHADTRHFTLGPAGDGDFEARLAPHPRDDRLVAVEWGVEYWNDRWSAASGREVDA